MDILGGFPALMDRRAIDAGPTPDGSLFSFGKVVIAVTQFIPGDGPSDRIRK